MAKELHIRIRKKLSKRVHKLLFLLSFKKLNKTPIDTNHIKNILVVRINYRIGNILFMTPLLNALSKEFPDAKIDMIVGASFTSSLIENMPQINKVYDFPRTLLKQPLKLLKFKKMLNNNHYDLIINPNPHSSSNSFFTAFIKSTYKLGFALPNKFSPLTHSVDRSSLVTHEALKPLLLLSALSSKKMDEFAPYLDIKLSTIEKEKHTIEPHAIGIFRDARGDKKLDNTWWKDLLNELLILDKNLHFIDILDPNNTTPLNKNIKTLSEKNLRVLSAKISHLDAFICADTGPMHLASASQTPTIALFKTTSPTYYGTLGKKDTSLVLKDKNITTIAKEILTHLKKVKTDEI